MYESYWDSAINQPRNRCIESFGYEAELRESGTDNPVSYYKEVVVEREKQRLKDLGEETRPRAFIV